MLCSFSNLALNFAFSRSFTKDFLVKQFPKPVMIIMELGFVTRFVSRRVLDGFGMFCSSVMAKVASKWQLRTGMWSASAKMR